MKITRALILEAAVVIGILAAGVFAGSIGTRHVTNAPDFYQHEFGPAVMVAAGRGFVNPAPPSGSPLAEFLAVRRATLDRSDAVNAPIRTLDQFQQATRYLMLVVGYWWRLSGISWPALAWLEALMYGLTVVACYAICRLCLPRMLAIVGAVFVAASPVHLSQAPYLRDYVKAPFILFAIPLTVATALSPMSPRRLAMCSAACGLVVGLGAGFRMDVVIMAPIFLVSVLCFRGTRPWTGLPEKALAAGVFLFALAVAAAPIVSRLSAGGSNAFHVILLGYSDPFHDGLGVRPSVYSVLPFYSDVYAWEVVSEHAARHQADTVQYLTPAYDAATRAYWMQIVRHFPADVAARALGASNAVLNLPFNQPRTGGAFDVLSVLNGWGAVFGAVLVGVAWVQRARFGMFAAWLVLVLTAYSSLQFEERHFFHLEIVSVVALLLTLRVVVRTRLPSRGQVRTFVLVIVGLGAAGGVVLGVLRAYQSAHVASLIDGYIDAPRQRVEPTFTETSYGTWQMRWDDVAHRARPPAADYYVVEFDGPSGDNESWLSLRYQDVAPDYSRISTWWSGRGIVRLFIPAYGTPPRAFEGIELSAGLKDRLRGVSRIDSPERVPLLLTLRLPDQWRHTRLYQTFRIEHPHEADTVPVVGDPAGAAQSRMVWLDRFDSTSTRPSPATVQTSYSPAARVVEGRVEMDGVARDQSTYLLGFKPIEVRGPAALLVKGHLEHGGLTFGVLDGVHWYRQAVARDRGDFVAVIQIPESGTYTPLITNGALRNGERTSFVLSRFGIVSAESRSN
jgi:hypothetical protein